MTCKEKPCGVSFETSWSGSDLGFPCFRLPWSHWEIKKEPKPDYALGTPSGSVPHCCHSHSSPSNHERHFHVSKVTKHVSEKYKCNHNKLIIREVISWLKSTVKIFMNLWFYDPISSVIRFWKENALAEMEAAWQLGIV